MPNIQIRDVPPEVHVRLKEQAAAAGQSLNEYMLGRLRDMASTLSATEFEAETAKLRWTRVPTREEIVEAIREGRAERGG